MLNPSSLLKRRSLCFLAASLLIWIPITVSAEDSSTEIFSRYARHGADVWARNPVALISGEGKACISCHTSLPYALVEPLLADEYSAYTDLIENIDNRILTWSSNTPWYAHPKLEQTAALSNLPPDALKGILNGADSRGVEAVFNALIRATHDAYSRKPAQTETRRAFENMWAEQVQSGPAAGRWRWIQANLVPWEVTDSDLWGASLACVAASIFPDLAPVDNRRLLHGTLKEASSDAEVSLHVKAAVLWCDSETGGQVLEAGVARQLATELLARQHDNGGWALRDLGPFKDWEGSDSDCCQKREVRPDAYASGLVTLALTRSRHLLCSDQKTGIADAVAWIDRQLSNPYPDGPRYNKHGTGDAFLPEFRNNLYTNGGHMWAFLAKASHVKGQAPWGGN